jgi:hypothetical protein
MIIAILELYDMYGGKWPVVSYYFEQSFQTYDEPGVF